MRQENLSLDSLPGQPLSELWKEALQALEAHPGCGRLPRWFLQNLQAAELGADPGGVLVVRLSSQLTREWLEKKYRTLLEEVLSGAADSAVELRVEACAAPAPRSRRAERTATPAAAAPGGPPETGSPPEKGETPREPAPTEANPGRRKIPADVIRARLSEHLQCAPLNPKYTFGTFVPGENNRFAHAAACAVAAGPGASYNPLFVHGGVGLGKTHLAHAIGQEIQAKQPDAVIAYLSGEAFTSSFVTAIRERKMEEFRRLYRHVDVWLVDDIQFIASKERTGEEFFHTFNALYDTNRQVVICADRPPHELQILDDRMASRFEAGLVADIGPPSFETRLAILRQKVQSEGALIPADVLEMMAQMIHSNVRVLEGALIRILAHASFTNSTINLSMATALLSRYFDGNERVPVRVEAVQRVVCDSLDVPIEAVYGKKRDRRSLMARQMAMFLSRELTDCSLEQIGQLFGGKDHSTVAHACRTFQQAIHTDATLERTTARVRDRIRRVK